MTQEIAPEDANPILEIAADTMAVKQPYVADFIRDVLIKELKLNEGGSPAEVFEKLQRARAKLDEKSNEVRASQAPEAPIEFKSHDDVSAHYDKQNEHAEKFIKALDGIGSAYRILGIFEFYFAQKSSELNHMLETAELERSQAKTLDD